MDPKYRIFTGNDGQIYFRLEAANGQTILQSQGYSSKDAARKGIESVRDNCTTEDRFDLKQARDGEHFFNVKAPNGQVIGKSQMYKETSGRDNGVASVQQNGVTSTVVDETA